MYQQPGHCPGLQAPMLCQSAFFVELQPQLGKSRGIAVLFAKHVHAYVIERTYTVNAVSRPSNSYSLELVLIYSWKDNETICEQ